MEINRLIKNGILSDLHFVTLSFAIWIIALTGFAAPDPHIPFAQLLFICTTAFVSVAFLKMLQCDSPLQGTPTQSDIFVRTIAFTLGAVLGQFLFYLFAPKGEFFLPELILLKIIPLSIITFGGYYFVSTLLLKLEHKRKIFLDLTPKERALFLEGMQHLGMSSLVRYLTATEFELHLNKGILNQIDMIVISHEEMKQFETDTNLLKAHLAGVPIIDIGQIICKMTGRVKLSDTDLTTYLLNATQKTLTRRVLLKLRYLLEPAGALLLAAALSPVILVTAITIKLTSPGPVFYKQIRTGYLGKQFVLYKFRSMQIDAEKDGPQWAMLEDRRVTPFGAFLRRTRLDEIPQLWNVIRGEMSFIGPRPERPEIYRQLEEDVPLFTLRTLVRPGITGWAQVTAGYAASAAESLLKLEYDLFYIQHMSLQFDFHVLIQTFKTVFWGDNKRDKRDADENQALPFGPETAIGKISQ